MKSDFNQGIRKADKDPEMTGAREMRRQRKLPNRLLPVDFAAMANPVDHHTVHRVLNRVEDAIISDAHPVGVSCAFQLLGLRGSGGVRQALDRALDRGTNLMGQTVALSSSGRGVEDRVHGPGGLGLEGAVNLRHREEPVAPMGFDVGKVLEVFQQVDQLPEFMDRELNSSPPSSDVHHVLGMQCGHRIFTISCGNWRVKGTEFRGHETRVRIWYDGKRSA